MPVLNLIQIRQGTSAEWAAVDPILDLAEPGYDTDLKILKWGNGVDIWSALTGSQKVEWADLLNKPSDFIPAAHAASHEFGGADAITIEPSQVTGLNSYITSTNSAIAGKAEAVHTHAISDVTGLDTALALKAPIASPALTGTATAESLSITGDLTVGGTTTTVNAQDLVVNDPLIYIAEGNAANVVDVGVVGSFDDGTYQHTGLVRDATDGKWKLFKGVTDEPTTTVNFAQGSLDALAVGSLEVGTVSNTEISYLDGVTSAIQTQLNGKAATSHTHTLSQITDYVAPAQPPHPFLFMGA